MKVLLLEGFLCIPPEFVDIYIYRYRNIIHMYTSASVCVCVYMYVYDQGMYVHRDANTAMVLCV